MMRRLPDCEELVCGLMSGTSVDGIDAAVVRCVWRGGQLVEAPIAAALTVDLPEAVRREIMELFEDGPGSLERLTVLNFRLGRLLGEAALAACAKAGIAPADLTLAASHGQTIRHVALPRDCAGTPERGSLQIGEASLIAEMLGVPVLADFRTADISAGGTGAPLVPFLDALLARSLPDGSAFLNLGGIGNVCWFAAPGSPPVAFDTGPGNMIADRLAAIASGGKLACDRDGQLGRRGRIDSALVARWLGHPFFQLRPPRTAGREEFGSRFFEDELKPLLEGADSQRHCDLVRSAERFTAASVAEACARWLPGPVDTLVVTGGGAHNPLIMADLRQLMPQCQVVSGDEVGVSVDFKEAQAFAVMGAHSYRGLPCTLPGATGARHPVIGGKLSLPPGFRMAEVAS